ncbi:hypothetical protein [Streptomyces sp. NPDC004546]|uniref:hypothetical protein n=1 Tax=Streptomyces sp. NPDC004546 TaxID=3154282 RepID=UPI0033BCEFE7
MLALEGEPRADFAPGTAMLHRYAVKAAELGVGVSTIRRWTAALKKSGPAGLVMDRPVRNVVERAHPRWVDMAESVLKANVKASRPVRGLILTEIGKRLVKEYGKFFCQSAPSPAGSSNLYGRLLLGGLHLVPAWLAAG